MKRGREKGGNGNEKGKKEKLKEKIGSKRVKHMQNWKEVRKKVSIGSPQTTVRRTGKNIIF